MSALAGLSDTELRRELEHRVDLSPMVLMAGLSLDATAIDAACERMAQQIKCFEGTKDGELGVKLRWEAALDQAQLDIEAEMLSAARDDENKLPAALKARGTKMMEAEARIRVKSVHPDLWIEYSDMEAELKALGLWIRSKERSSSLRQSILSAQKQASTME